MLQKDIFTISSPESFKETALRVFRFQYHNTPVYREFCDLLGTKEEDVTMLEDIPFLPIQFFKDRSVVTKDTDVQKIFTSSGTTGSILSKHLIADLTLYETSFLKTFTQFYGAPEDWVILALLPSYLEREGSSLVYMAKQLIDKSESLDSGFYLYDTENLVKKLQKLESQQRKVLLLGVSHALLDLIEEHSLQLRSTQVMETGGMKGRRKELIRDELHDLLTKGLGVKYIHSEYGMTELLSQAYSQGNGLFECPPWMKVFTRDTEDAMSYVTKKAGGINIIDLANIYSCSFIATQDLGKVYSDGSFEILGRFDTSDIRGCNLMVL